MRASPACTGLAVSSAVFTWAVVTQGSRPGSGIAESGIVYLLHCGGYCQWGDANALSLQNLFPHLLIQHRSNAVDLCHLLGGEEIGILLF